MKTEKADDPFPLHMIIHFGFARLWSAVSGRAGTVWVRLNEIGMDSIRKPNFDSLSLIYGAVRRSAVDRILPVNS